MSYQIINAQLVEPDHLRTTVLLTLSDGSAKEVEVMSFRPPNTEAVESDIRSREEHEEMTLAALVQNRLVAASLQEAVGRFVTTNVLLPGTPFAMSKLKLRRSLRDMALEEMLDSFLESNPNRLKDWNDSQVIMTDDPMVLEMLPAFQSKTGLGDDVVAALFESCRN